MELYSTYFLQHHSVLVSTIPKLSSILPFFSHEDATIMIVPALHETCVWPTSYPQSRIIHNLPQLSFPLLLISLPPSHLTSPLPSSPLPTPPLPSSPHLSSPHPFSSLTPLFTHTHRWCSLRRRSWWTTRRARCRP